MNLTLKEKIILGIIAGALIGGLTVLVHEGVHRNYSMLKGKL